MFVGQLWNQADIADPPTKHTYVGFRLNSRCINAHGLAGSPLAQRPPFMALLHLFPLRHLCTSSSVCFVPETNGRGFSRLSDSPTSISIPATQREPGASIAAHPLLVDGLIH